MVISFAVIGVWGVSAALKPARCCEEHCEQRGHDGTGSSDCKWAFIEFCIGFCCCIVCKCSQGRRTLSPTKTLRCHLSSLHVYYRSSASGLILPKSTGSITCRGASKGSATCVWSIHSFAYQLKDSCPTALDSSFQHIMILCMADAPTRSTSLYFHLLNVGGIWISRSSLSTDAFFTTLVV